MHVAATRGTSALKGLGVYGREPDPARPLRGRWGLECARVIDVRGTGRREVALVREVRTLLAPDAAHHSGITKVRSE